MKQGYVCALILACCVGNANAASIEGTDVKVLIGSERENRLLVIDKAFAYLTNYGHQPGVEFQRTVGNLYAEIQKDCNQVPSERKSDCLWYFRRASSLSVGEKVRIEKNGADISVYKILSSGAGGSIGGVRDLTSELDNLTLTLSEKVHHLVLDEKSRNIKLLLMQDVRTVQIKNGVVAEISSLKREYVRDLNSYDNDSAKLLTKDDYSRFSRENSFLVGYEIELANKCLSSGWTPFIRQLLYFNKRFRNQQHAEYYSCKTDSGWIEGYHF